MNKGKLTVLIIEDQEINRLLLQGILKKEYNVVEAENGKDAFEKLRQHKDIAAILVDIIMPVMDGYTFLRKLKKSEFSSLPVIMVTGEKDDDTE
ncbi:response regulator [Aminicella lysinilytica]|nr:response regulator [Aminicella lysinilytica]